MMVKFFFILILCLFAVDGFSQKGEHKSGKTIFDSVLVAKIGYTYNQYYNKLLSDYYKKNNYKGLRKHIKVKYYDFIFTRKTPLLVINGEPIESFKHSIYTIQEYKKIISVEVIPPDRRLKGTERDYYRWGAILFQAEK